MPPTEVERLGKGGDFLPPLVGMEVPDDTPILFSYSPFVDGGRKEREDVKEVTKNSYLSFPFRLRVLDVRHITNRNWIKMKFYKGREWGVMEGGSTDHIS